MAQWHYGPEGEVIWRRRKLKPTHVERSVFGEGDGSDIIVTQTNFGRVGALCCWEHLQPLSKYAMFSQDEQIHCAAWPSFTSRSKPPPALKMRCDNSASRWNRRSNGPKASSGLTTRKRPFYSLRISNAKPSLGAGDSARECCFEKTLL